MNPYIAEVDLAAMVLQAHVAFERLILNLVDLALIDIKHFLRIHADANVRTNAFDIEDIPLRSRLDGVLLGCNIAIEGTTAIFRRLFAGVVEKLDLIGDVRR